MGKPYSMDVHERAVGAVFEGRIVVRFISRRPLNLALGSARSSIGCGDFRTRGSVAYRPDRRGTRSRRRLPAKHRGLSGAAAVREGVGLRYAGASRELAERRLKVDYRSGCGTSSTPKGLASGKGRRRQRARSDPTSALPARPVDEPAEPDRS